MEGNDLELCRVSKTMAERYESCSSEPKRTAAAFCQHLPPAAGSKRLY